MSTLRKALALTSLLVCLIASAATKEYENFDLPKSSRTAPESTGFSYNSSRVQLKAGTVRVKEPSFSAQQYVAAKEAYLAEKRDEAIKLLRQEMDTGLKRNRDNLLMRLGQLYSEKYMELSARESEVFSKQLEDFEKAKKLGKNPTAPKMDNSRSQHYLKEALSLFSALEKEYPKHARIDEVVFFIGFVEMEYGNVDKGKKYLERVVREFPRSRKFEEAVVFLGDHYFEKTKFRDAFAKYKILTVRKDSPMLHYARYKIAWCELNMGSPENGLRDMKALISDLAGDKEAGKFNLREQAIKDLVIFYGEVGEVNEALAYFTEVWGRDKAIEGLRLIAEILKTKARDDAALQAYKILLDEFPNAPDAPRLVAGIHESQARLGKTDAAVRTLVEGIETFGPSGGWLKNVKSDKQAEAKASVEYLGTEAQKAAFFYHSSGQKSSNKKSSGHAATLYRALLQHYPQHAEKKKIAFYLGELLFSDGKWLDASDAYMTAARTAPKDKIADEAAYNALLALDRLTAKNDNLERYTKDNAKNVDMTPEEIPNNEKRFIEVAEFYLKEYPTGDRIVDVRFRIAAIYYKFHHFDKAQASFQDIALKYPRHKSATTAAHIVLDIYNLKKDYANLDVTAGKFAKVDGLGDAKFKTEMAQLSGEISFKKIEALEAQNKWKESGDAYYAFYKNDPTGTLAEKSLYNAFVSYEKADQVGLASETSRLFIAKYPNSEYSKKFTLNMAKLAEKQYDFDQAQKLYQDFAKKYPSDKEARKALYNAAVFAELLEFNKLALTLYQDYLKQGKVSADEEKSIQISFAKLHRKEGEWDKMAAVYRKLMRGAKTEDKLAYLAEMARHYEKGGRIKERGDIMNEIKVVYEGSKVKDAGAAAQFVAEARFKAVTAQREKYEKIQLKFPAEDFLYLLNRKQKTLAKLATSYDSVVEVGVPDWGVAALWEKSAAFDGFVKGFRAVKLPAKYKGDDKAQIEKELKTIETNMIVPLEAKSNEFLKACAAKASEFYVDNVYANKCREKMQAAGTVVEPSGVYPKPSYWTTRWAGGGVVKR